MEYDISYVGDYDGRNATRAPVVLAHSAAGTRPVARVPVMPGGTTVANPRYVLSQTGQHVGGYLVHPDYVASAPTGYVAQYPQNNLASILGGFGDIGTLANIAAQVFAAFLPMPTAPEARTSTDTDVLTFNAAANSADLITYQTALAKFARRDQQILTLGSVLKELFKRPFATVG